MRSSPALDVREAEWRSRPANLKEPGIDRLRGEGQTKLQSIPVARY